MGNNAGVAEAADPVTGITSPLLSDLATYTACVINGGLQARDVNKQQLLAELAAVKPARPLAGIQTFQLIYMPTINLASYVDVSARLGRCAVAIAQTLIAPVPAVVEVPFACQSLVDYLATYADTSLRQLVPLVADGLLSPLMSYIKGVLNVIAPLLDALEKILSSDTWNAYINAAREAAAAKGCPDPGTCYGGLLSDAWRELNKLPAALNGTHQVGGWCS
ncbi:hypothetical protein OEZ86_011540 [Tetradesmus obliquus]|nr:hypothetical protein OEZ86_011540 [Tetradesmus obliquus]